MKPSTGLAPRREPLLLRLPRAAILGGFGVARLARASGDRRSASDVEHRFGFRAHELRFVRGLLERHADLWLYRPDQRRACGDLVVVPMAAPRDTRACVVVELKQRTRVRIGSRHLQLAQRDVAAAELVHRGVLGNKPRVVTVFGSVDVPLLRRLLSIRPRALGSA